MGGREVRHPWGKKEGRGRADHRGTRLDAQSWGRDSGGWGGGGGRTSLRKGGIGQIPSRMQAQGSAASTWICRCTVNSVLTHIQPHQLRTSSLTPAPPHILRAPHSPTGISHSAVALVVLRNTL